MSLDLKVGDEEVDSLDEFHEKAVEGFRAIGPVQKVEEGGHEMILDE